MSTQECSAGWPVIKLLDLRVGENHVDLQIEPPTSSFEAFSDYDTLSQLYSSDISSDKTVIFQSLQTVPKSDSLFYTSVSIENGATFKALIDSGSMACTLSESAEANLVKCIPNIMKQSAQDIVIVGCGGHRVTPTAIYDLQITVYGDSMTVPTLVVPGQTEEFILGTNAIKTLLMQLRETSGYWRLLSVPSRNQSDECCEFLSLFSNTERWRGESVPERVGTVKLQRSVTLEPQTEHLVWGKLPMSSVLSVGSTVVVEPTKSRSRPKQIMVGRVITPLWGDGSIPLKVINPTSHRVVLRRNTKIADVSPCIAVEDLSQPSQIKSNVQCAENSSSSTHRSSEDMRRVLCDLNLSDIDLVSCEVSAHWKDRLLQIIESHESIFSRDKMDCGEAKGFVHRIHLTDDRPFRMPYRRIPPSQYAKLRTALNEMEEKGIIRKSHSDYASPLVLVWKKNGDLRICTDFRWLNARTVRDAYPLPHQVDVLAALGGNAFFSTMDLTSGYYNVPLQEEHKKYTTFSSPFGLHEYNRLPQGLSNSPATFMRMMMSIFGDENFSSVLCYLDDLMVFAPSESVALERLEMVFSRLARHNLKLAPKKCFFLRRSVKFLGHIICEEGIKTDPDKVEAINKVQRIDLMEANGQTPCPKKIRSFLGMVLYYQHFIKGCSAKAKPLFQLTSGSSKQSPVRKGRKPRKRMCYAELTPSDWTPACQSAFEALKSDLLLSVILAHPLFDQPFILAIDASFDGVGAVLSQVPPGEEVARPVAFASRTLSRSQMNYPAHRLEFFALKWAVCEKFSHWLKGRHFTAWTDNNPLTYVLTKPRLDACEQRWVAKLASYSFDLKYVPGPRNVVADALSREPFVQSCISHRLITEPYVSLLKDVCGVGDDTVQHAFKYTNNHQMVLRSGNEPHSTPSSGSGSVEAQEISAVLSAHSTGGLSEVLGAGLAVPQLQQANTPIPHSSLVNQQGQDETISRVLYYVERRRRPSKSERTDEPSSVRQLLRYWDKLVIRDGVLCKVRRDGNMNRRLFLFLVPDSLKAQVLNGIHDAAGHQGKSRTLSLARQRFFWVGLKRDVDSHVENCRRCVVGKTPEPNACAPLENIRTSEPMELVCIDFWSAEVSEGTTMDVLVVTDHFSKMAHAFPCRNQSAKQVARKLWNDFFLVYGFPKRIHSDQGANFESKLIKELLTLSGVEKSHTTPYHPMGNGVAERFNRTLGSMIRTLPPKSKAKWPQMLQLLTFCYNCTEHETTGFAPFYLMFGRVPRLPVDILFQSVLSDEVVVDHSEFVSRLKKDLREAVQIAQRHSQKEQTRHARLYNRKVKGSPLAIGDRVLVANRGERGKRKVADKWESSPYKVVAVNPVINVYKIKDVNSDRVRVVHRNLLLPVDFLPLDDEQDLQPSEGDEAVPEVSLLDEEISVGDRTAHWVYATPNFLEGECQVHHTDDPDVSECVLEPGDSASGIVAKESEQYSDVLPVGRGSPDAEHDSVVPTHEDTMSDEPAVCAQPQSFENAVTQTRQGRAIKPPKRLICEMNGQVLDTSESTVNSLISLVVSLF